jgi:hypothetical protein
MGTAILQGDAGKAKEAGDRGGLVPERLAPLYQMRLLQVALWRRRPAPACAGIALSCCDCCQWTCGLLSLKGHSLSLQVRQARRRIAGVRNFFRSVERRLTLDANGVSPGPFSLPRRGRHRSQSSAKLLSDMRCFSMVALLED